MNALLITLAVLCADDSFIARSKVETKKYVVSFNAAITQARRDNKDIDEIHRREAVLKMVKSGKAVIAAPFKSEPKRGDYGRFEVAIVRQVIDSDNALLELLDESVIWVKVSTTGWVDLQVDLRHGDVVRSGNRYTSFVPYKITGYTSYNTLLGKKTVPVAEQLTEEERQLGPIRILTDAKKIR